MLSCVLFFSTDRSLLSRKTFCSRGMHTWSQLKLETLVNRWPCVLTSWPLTSLEVWTMRYLKMACTRLFYRWTIVSDYLFYLDILRPHLVPNDMNYLFINLISQVPSSLEAADHFISVKAFRSDEVIFEQSSKVRVEVTLASFFVETEKPVYQPGQQGGWKERPQRSLICLFLQFTFGFMAWTRIFCQTLTNMMRFSFLIQMMSWSLAGTMRLPAPKVEVSMKYAT